MLNKTHAVLAMTVLAATAQAATIRVPQDSSTIQAAIDAAVAGDTVLVAPGTYNEAIDFKGKAITVTSSNGAKKTIIDAGRTNSVVRFHTSETRASVLSGFTLRNGNATEYPLDGGGVQIFQASPTIRGNVVTNSSACSGNGIAASFSSALIVDNHIHHNHQDGCGGGTTGGGILVGGAGAVEVTDNLIEYNQTDMDGGGIGMFAAGQPLIARNTIRYNTAGSGGGISTVNGSSPTVIDNLVHGNTAGSGGGLSLSVPSGEQGGLWVNNTIANNSANKGSELYTDGFASQVQLTNNIFYTSKGPNSLVCDDLYQPISPIFRSNDVFASNGATVGGVCAAAAGQNGNVAVDPLFNTAAKGTKAYALTAGSPAIDIGVKTTVAGDTDLLGHKRRVDGNGDGRKVIDLGAIEYGVH